MGFLGATFWWMTWNDDLYNTHPQNHQVFDVVCHLSLLVSDVGKFNFFNFCSLNCTGTVPMLSRELSHDRLATVFSCISFSTLNACLGKKKHLFLIHTLGGETSWNYSTRTCTPRAFMLPIFFWQNSSYGVMAPKTQPDLHINNAILTLGYLVYLYMCVYIYSLIVGGFNPLETY